MTFPARRAPWALALVFLVRPAFAADPPPVREAGKEWSGSVSAGLSLTRGNSDTKNFNLAFDFAQRLSAQNVAKYTAFYLRADQNGALTVDRASVGARDEYRLSPLTFAFAEVLFLRDRFKEIDYLAAPAAGMGHRLIKDARLDLSVEGGLGLVVEKDSAAGRTTSGAFQAKQGLRWKFSPTATVTQAVSGVWKVSHLADALLHSETSLAGDLTGHTQLKVSVIDDYKGRPPPGVRRNDVSLIAAFVMKF